MFPVRTNIFHNIQVFFTYINAVFREFFTHGNNFTFVNTHTKKKYFKNKCN